MRVIQSGVTTAFVIEFGVDYHRKKHYHNSISSGAIKSNHNPLLLERDQDHYHHRQFTGRRRRTTMIRSSDEDSIDLDSLTQKMDKNCLLLSDLPTPCVLIELSLLERRIKEYDDNNEIIRSIDDDDDDDDDDEYDDFILNYILNNNNNNNSEERQQDNDDDDKRRKKKKEEALLLNLILDGCVFVHTKVINTTLRDAITKEYGSGKSPSICFVDADTKIFPYDDDSEDDDDDDCGGAYLGIGLANHHVGGYYWARGMGIGASLEAHGVGYRRCCRRNSSSGTGELYWKKRGEEEGRTTQESSNSNDGKRSEWVDFVSVGDTVQLIPYNPHSLLISSSSLSPSAGGDGTMIYGIRRIGRPLGADPIVEKIWFRSSSSSPRWKSKKQIK